MKDRRRWDALDIASLVNSVLDAFAEQFYGKSFDALTDKQASRILSAMHEHVQTLKEAQQ